MRGLGRLWSSSEGSDRTDGAAAGDTTVLVDYNPGGVSRRYAVLKRLAEKTV